MCGRCVDGLEWELEASGPPDEPDDADAGADEYEEWFWGLG